MLPVALFLAASALTAPVPKVPAPELVSNGSFEEGPELPDGWAAVDKDSTKITGWTVTRGQIDVLSTCWEAGEGKRSLDLHGTAGYGGVAQTLKTTKGRTYTVTFQMACNPGGSVKEKSLWVAVAGEKKKFTFNATGKSVTDMGWEKMTWEFTATADETELEIYTAETTDEFCGPALDAVSVKEKR